MCVISAAAAGGATAAMVANASMAASALGTVASAYGSYQQSKAQSAQQEAQNARAEYQAQLAENEAIRAENNAKDARARGRAEEEAYRRRVQGLQGEQRAAFAGSGVDVGSGSAVDVFADTAQMGEIDALVIRENTERRASAFENRAASARAQGEMFSAASQTPVPDNAAFTAGTTLLGGLGQTAGMAYNMGAGTGGGGGSGGSGARLRIPSGGGVS